MKSRQQVWQEQNKETYYPKVYAARKKRRAARKAFVDDYKRNKPCHHCGGLFDPVCMDFHHTGEKDDAVGRLVGQAAAQSRIEAEIAKCILLCANCHRLHHHGILPT